MTVQADPVTAIQADPGTALLLDHCPRRLAQAAEASGLALAAHWTVPSPVGAVLIRVALLRRCGEGTRHSTLAFPTRIAAGEATCYRLLDRFYVPILPDPAISAALFDVIASAYDALTNREVNAETARTLLEAVLPPNGDDTCCVLDFGCGTGIALEAARGLHNHSPCLRLIGTDVCQAMLDLAARRGEPVLRLHEWRLVPGNSFDGVISAFVFHYGVPRLDLLRIIHQLRNGGRFALNYFRADAQAVDLLVSDLTNAGLTLERIGTLNTTPGTSNPMLIFRKPTRGHLEKPLADEA